METSKINCEICSKIYLKERCTCITQLNYNIIFDGYSLLYKITNTFLNNIREQIKSNEIKFYDNNNKVLKFCIPGNYYYIPIGLFSNTNFSLRNCHWENTTRNIKPKKMPNFKKLESKIVLNKVQELIVKRYFEMFNSITTNNKCPVYLNLIGQCSIGKTLISIYLSHVFGYRTFVILPSIELTKQWKNEIEKFIINIKCFASLNGIKNIKNLNELLDYDIICFPYKHLQNINFCNFLMNNFSMGIIDEQHTYNLENDNLYLKKFFTFFNFQIFLSLTATPRIYNSLYLGKELNTDEIVKLNKKSVFKKICYEINLSQIKYIRSFSIPDQIKSYEKIYNKKNKNKNDLISLNILKKRIISQDENRIRIIVNKIVKNFVDNHNPKILVLTKFVSEINMYYKRILDNLDQESHKDIYEIYAKDKNEKSLNSIKSELLSKEKFILIGTGEHIGTGIDIVELNELHLTSIPKLPREIIQYVGRVSRNNPSPDHYVYYYNINSFKQIKIVNEISIIRNTLIDNDWDVFNETI